MFKEMKAYSKIIVTGPQRSGTRICSKMIAHDTGHRWAPEEEIGGSGRPKLDKLMRNDKRVVVHCPALSSCIQEYGKDNALIVFMRRDLGDIEASENRIGWSGGPHKSELLRYETTLRYKDANLTAKKRPSREITYEYWEEFQRDHVAHWREVEYESLSEHPLWVPKGQRAGWIAHQTENES